jgi:hypothetical protein
LFKAIGWAGSSGSLPSRFLGQSFCLGMVAHDAHAKALLAVSTSTTHLIYQLWHAMFVDVQIHPSCPMGPRRPKTLDLDHLVSMHKTLSFVPIGSWTITLVAVTSAFSRYEQLAPRQTCHLHWAPKWRWFAYISPP